MGVVDIARKRRLKKRLKRVSAPARSVAHESRKTEKIRRKLLAKWEWEKSQITPKAIADTIEKMHRWIADHAKTRVPMNKIALFDGGEHAASVSRKVQKIAEKLRTLD